MGQAAADPRVADLLHNAKRLRTEADDMLARLISSVKGSSSPAGGGTGGPST
jgi:hypothetical protein